MSAKFLLSTFLGIIFLVFGFWFSSNSISISNAAVWAIPEVCSDNLIQKQNEITCLWNGGGGPPFHCSVHAECCVLCEVSTAACIIIEPDRSPFDAWSYTDNERDSSGGYQSDCIDIGAKWTYCERSISGACPIGYSGASYEGYNCGIFKEKDVDNIYAAKGKWNASQEECITCNGKIEDKVCANTGLSFFNNSGDCNGAGDGTFQLACDTSISVDCDDKLVGEICDTGKKCDANGQCVLTGSMTLQISASDNPMEINDTTTVTFTTEKSDDGTDINGADVSITSISCGTLPDPGSVTSSGKTTSTFTAPGSAGNCEIKAKATHDDYDDATATYVISVQSADCMGDYKIWFDDDDYVEGDTLELWGKDFANGNDSILCLYKDDLSNDKDNEFLSDGAFPTHLDYSSASIGTWRGGLFKDSVFCGDYGDADCQTEVVVSDSGPEPCTDNGDGCSDDSDCCSGNCNGGVCVPNCPSTLSCATALSVADADAGCKCGDAYATSVNVGEHCCAKDDTFYATLELCEASLCGGSGSCNNNNVKEDGEACDGTDLAGEDCIGLGFTGGILSCLDCNFDTSLCTGDSSSACDPDNWYFCNPLRGTVETIVQAGETMLGYILGLIGSISLLFIIIAGMIYMTSAGNEERISSSKRILSGAVIGLMIALLAYGMLQVIMTVLGM